MENEPRAGRAAGEAPAAALTREGGALLASLSPWHSRRRSGSLSFFPILSIQLVDMFSTQEV